MYDQETLLKFMRIYKNLSSSYKDPHQQFAEELVCSREKAKQLAHKINHTYSKPL